MKRIKTTLGWVDDDGVSHQKTFPTNKDAYAFERTLKQYNPKVQISKSRN